MGVDHRGFHIAVTEHGDTWPQASVAEPLRMAEGAPGPRP